MNFVEKTVIITGGTSGIGRSAAIKYGILGAKVVVVGRTENNKDETIQMLEEEKIEALFLKGDVSNIDDTQNIIKQTVETFESVDILVNAAGIVLGGRADNTKEEDWDRTLDINLKGVYLMSKFAVPEMKKSGGGVIINISSTIALKGTKDRLAYAASKGGVISMTKAMATDYLEDNIRVNCICPGATYSPSLVDRLSSLENSEEAMKKILSKQPMGRLGKASEIAEVIVLASSDSVSFMNGAIVPVDGGMSM